MPTLVYSPKVSIRIGTSRGAIIDVSEDVTSGTLTRVNRGVSTASWSMLNQSRKYDGLFAPMDKVIIYMRRLRPMLVFSGYLDTVPLWSAYPGSVSMAASCSLKRLQYSYWDPESPAAIELWGASKANEIDKDVTDGGMAIRTTELLTEVGGWAREQIHIAAVPQEWFDSVSDLADTVISEAETAFGEAQVEAHVLAGSSGGGGGGSGAAGSFGAGAAGVWKSMMSTGYFTKQQIAGIMGNMAEESSFIPTNRQNDFGPDQPTPAGITEGGYGLVQWSPGSKLGAYIGNNTKSTIANNVDTIVKQLQGKGPFPEGDAGRKFKKTKTVAEACRVFHIEYERSDSQVSDSRITAAQRIYNQFAGGMGPSGEPPNQQREARLAEQARLSTLQRDTDYLTGPPTGTPADADRTTDLTFPGPYAGAKASDEKKGKVNWGPPGQDGDMVSVSAAGCSFTVNKIAADMFVGFVKDLVSQFGYHPKVIGGYSVRPINGGGGTMSNHSWGAAIDIDSTRNPVDYSPPWVGYALPKPPGIIKLARKWGLGWGGEWNSLKDWMHFEVIGAPSSPHYSGKPGMLPGGGTTVEKWKMPVKGAAITNPFGVAGGTDYAAGYHTGVDITPVGQIHPVGPGTIKQINHLEGDYGNNVHVYHGKKVWTTYNHIDSDGFAAGLKVGQTVGENTVFGRSDSTGHITGPHLHLELRFDKDEYGSPYAKDISKYITGGPNRPNPPRGVGGFGTAGAGAGGGPGGGLNVEDFGAAVFNVYEWIKESTDAGSLLTGYRALMNDVPMLQTVEEYMTTCLRDYCSAPNGDFIGWFPDYFGKWGQAGKMIITPLEIDGETGPPTIGWSDTYLKTHQFVTSSSLSQAGDAATIDQMIGTAGIASVEFPELMSALFKVDPDEFADLGVTFLERYGARPEHTPMDQISGARQEFFFSVYLFMQNWSAQYSADINITFMPELWPGMLACFPDFGMQGYVTEVTHTWDLGEGGRFSTSMSCAPWSSIGENGPDGLPRGAPL